MYRAYISFQGNELGGEGWCLSREINLLSEGVRLGLSQKKTPRDSTQTYSPRGLTFSDGPRMTPSDNKLVATAAITTLTTLMLTAATATVAAAAAAL